LKFGRQRRAKLEPASLNRCRQAHEPGRLVWDLARPFFMLFSEPICFLNRFWIYLFFTWKTWILHYGLFYWDKTTLLYKQEDHDQLWDPTFNQLFTSTTPFCPAFSIS
jgi:hypothetical protein